MCRGLGSGSRCADYGIAASCSCRGCPGQLCVPSSVLSLRAKLSAYVAELSTRVVVVSPAAPVHQAASPTNHLISHVLYSVRETALLLLGGLPWQAASRALAAGSMHPPPPPHPRTPRRLPAFWTHSRARARVPGEEAACREAGACWRARASVRLLGAGCAHREAVDRRARSRKT